MKKFLVLSGALAGILLFSGCGSKGWKTIDGVIVFDTPAREPGQESVLGLRTAPMETVRVGFVGLGMRGPGAVDYVCSASLPHHHRRCLLLSFDLEPDHGCLCDLLLLFQQSQTLEA